MKQFATLCSFVSVLVLGHPGLAAARAPYDLGELPEGFAVDWPSKPAVDRRVEVRSAEEFNTAAATPGTRIVVRESIPSVVSISASDVDVRMAAGVSVRGVTIQKGLERIRMRGGRVEGGGITMAYPTEYYPSHDTREQWMIRDVMFDGISVHADADTTALNLRGERVALIKSYLRGGEYAIWSDTSAPLQNSDVIIAGNVLESEGDQCTVRLVGVRHAVTVDNRIEDLMLTGTKHTFRVHGHSDQVFAARNLLVNGGTMFGTMPGDEIGEMWFEDNDMHHATEDLFHPDFRSVAVLHARGNTAYSARACFLCGTARDLWDVTDNALLPYEPAPDGW
jgi:hypothetical protein